MRKCAKYVFFWFIVPGCIVLTACLYGVSATGSYSYKLKIRRVQASSEQVPNPLKQETFIADHVKDGAEWTRWSSIFKDRQWLVLDLGQAHTIREIHINWEDACATKYIVRISNDGVKWKKVYQTDGGKGGKEQLKFSPQQGRYIRFDFIKRATDWGVSIWEIEVYGRRLNK